MCNGYTLDIWRVNGWTKCHKVDSGFSFLDSLDGSESKWKVREDEVGSGVWFVFPHWLKVRNVAELL